MRQALAVMGKRVEQLAECRCDRLLVRQTVEHRALTASGVGTPSRHVGRLIPIQYVARRGQIADLAQAPLELNQLLLGRASVARRLGCGHSLSGCWHRFADLLHVRLGLIRVGVISAKSQSAWHAGLLGARRAALIGFMAGLGRYFNPVGRTSKGTPHGLCHFFCVRAGRDSARGQTDSIGLGNTLQPRCDVDAIAHQVRLSP